MTYYLSKNRAIAQMQLLLRNPISSVRHILSERGGKKEAHFFRIGGLGLWLRSSSPDFRVLRACAFGEFDEAFALAGPAPKFMIDGGGYIGIASILFAQRYPNAKIVCLEPSSDNLAMARRNCAAYPNIEVLHCALGAEPGRTTLSDRGTGEWGFSIAAADNAKKRDLEEVEVVTVDGLMARYGVETVDLLKLDIEGAEDEVFKTPQPWIDRVRVMIVELHERIRPGVTARYESVVSGRTELHRDAEKRLSVKEGLAVS